jgi:hypothetical protein
MIMASTFKEGIYVKPADRIDTLRLFLHNVDLLDESSDGWDMFGVVLSGESYHPQANFSVLEWMLTLFLADFANHISDLNLAWFLVSASQCNTTKLTEMIIATGVDISRAVFTDGFTPIHILIGMGFPGDSIAAIRILVQNGASLHVVGRTTGLGANPISPFETLTSIAMLRSSTFYIWRQLIRTLGHDYAEFIAEELDQAPLADAGWTKETLLLLFNWEFTPVAQKRLFCECGREILHLYRTNEDWWQTALSKIKTQEGPPEEYLESTTSKTEEHEGVSFCWTCCGN